MTNPDGHENIPRPKFLPEDVPVSFSVKRQKRGDTSRAFTVGLIEGLDESSALILKVFSGSLSGDSEKRKALACRCSWGLFSVAFVTVAASRLLDSHFFFKSLFKPSPILHNIGGIEFGSLSSDQ